MTDAAGLKETYPLVSVVVEGYNQSRELGVADATLSALRAQDYPLERIEIILVGSHAQVAEWQVLYANKSGFSDVRFVGFDAQRYYAFKNAGALEAKGEIVALTDSDVLPEQRWVSAMVETIRGGADASMGPTLFGHGTPFKPYSVLMRMASAITWGWVLGKPEADTGRPRSRGFMDHNIAMRAELWKEFQYRTDLGRIMASPLLYRRLVDGGKRLRVHPEQRAAHHFSWRYWLVSLQYRYGHEVYRLRRMDRDYPMRWMARTGPLEPLLTMVWHMMLDVPKWFRLNRVLGRSVWESAALLPAFVLVSAFARSFEMAGGFATILAPTATRKWAETL